MSVITIHCRLIAQEHTLQQLWELMANKNTPLVNELLERVSSHPEFLTWVEKGGIPQSFIQEQYQLLKADPRFSDQPGRFYSSAKTSVNYIYKSWIAIQSKLKQKIKNKQLWLEQILKSNSELEQEFCLTLPEILVKAQAILTKLESEIQKSQVKRTKANTNEPSNSSPTQNSNKRNDSKNKLKSRKIFDSLFQQYKKTEDPQTRAALIYLLKNNCQINDSEESLEDFEKRRNKKKIEIKRLQQQLRNRVPRSRDLTGQQCLEILEAATNTVPDSEEQSHFWQTRILKKSSNLPFPISYETNEDLTWLRNDRGKICVKFNGLQKLVFEIRCDRRQLHWFERFLEDQQIKRQSKDQHSASLFTLRSARINWQEGSGEDQPWNIHHLKLYCSLETLLWTAEGTQQIAQEKAQKIEKTLEKSKDKTDLTTSQKAHIQRKQSTLARLNTPFPRPSRSAYQGQSSIIVGVSLGLNKLATLAVVDVVNQKVLIYRSIKQLLGDNYHLLQKKRLQQQRDSRKRHKAQKQSGNNQFGTSQLGQQIDRLLAKEIVGIAQTYQAGSIALPQLKNMREIIHCEIQARAEQKIPGYKEGQKQYAKQYRASIHQWSYNRLIENITQKATQIGIDIEITQHIPWGHPQQQAEQLAIAAYQERILNSG